MTQVAEAGFEGEAVILRLLLNHSTFPDFKSYAVNGCLIRILVVISPRVLFVLSFSASANQPLK